MQIKRIFLASSSELEADRRAFEVTIARLNQRWKDRGFFFEVVVWENFIDALSKDGLQQEYNRAVRTSDLFVMLFFTKVGRYTDEEFQTAFGAFSEHGRPRIYTYFRNDVVKVGDLDDGIRSLLDFKIRLRELKHYVTHYTSIEHLQYLFSEQIDKLYGADAGLSMEVTDDTPQLKIHENAFVLTCRQLDDNVGRGQVEIAMLQASVRRASGLVRETIFGLADRVRRENWAVNKRLMERTIPIFEALVRSDPAWYAPHGSLGYALAARTVPEWRAAKESLDRAVELRGDGVYEGRFYNYVRAQCAVYLDPGYGSGQPADSATRSHIHELVRFASRDLGSDWEDVLSTPDAEALRKWLLINPLAASRSSGSRARKPAADLRG